jgi:hypothetical protein
MAPRISLTAISASFAVKVGKREAIAVMSSERVMGLILHVCHSLRRGAVGTSGSATAPGRSDPAMLKAGFMACLQPAIKSTPWCCRWTSQDLPNRDFLD